MDDIALRRAGPDDCEFACRIRKAAFREFAERAGGWDEDEQRRLHERRFGDRDVRLIRMAGTDVGILFTARAPDHVKLNPLFLQPEHQGRGLGRRCVALVLAEAHRLDLPVHLRVMKVNPGALAFFTKLRFQRTGETESHGLLEKNPD